MYKKKEQDKSKLKLYYKKTLFFKKRIKPIISCTIVLLIMILFFLSNHSYISTKIKNVLNNLEITPIEIKKIEINSDENSYPGSWSIEKKAEWLNKDTAQITFDVTSNVKMSNNLKDVILIIDVSGSMNGSKLIQAISDAKKLAEYLLSQGDNTISIITFGTQSTIVEKFSNNKEEVIEKLDSITTGGNRNYNSGLNNLNLIMEEYNKEENRDIVALFLTNGKPKLENPLQVGTYEMLKDKYPFLTIHGIQYEMGSKIINEIKDISDIEWNATEQTLKEIIFDAALSPISYEDFIVTDYIDDSYFTLKSENDISVTIGEAILDSKNQSKITWNLGKEIYKTGHKEQMKIIVSLKDEYNQQKGYFSTNKKESVISKLKDEKLIEVNSNKTPILKNNYNVIYETNTPTGCMINNPDKENYFIYQQVHKKTEELSCEGYLFKGWSVMEEDVEEVNNNIFIMPNHDVHIKAVWTKQTISKSMNGTVHEKTNLYKVLESEAKNGTYAREYTGEHQDSIDITKSTEKIYHFYGANDTKGTEILDRNNVIFANHCWQMIRTTDTGGVKMIYNGEVQNEKCLNTRDSHVGYSSRTTQNLNSNYWYGTDYSYDKETKTFKLIGDLEQSAYNESTIQNLKGKYTCKQTTQQGTCQTLYLVESEYNQTSAYVLAINSKSHYSQFGTLQFSKNTNSPAYVGYMYGDVYETNSINSTPTEVMTTVQTIFPNTSISTSMWFADAIDYGNIKNNKYSLIEPFKVSTTEELSNMVGKYTFRSTNASADGNVVYYIAGINDTKMYYKQLQNGELLSDIEPINIGKSIEDNNDGTYTIKESEEVQLKSWYTNYEEYKNYYICPDNSTVCQIPRYITNSTSTTYTYVDIRPEEKILISKRRNNLVLEDTILVRKDSLLIHPNDYSDYKYTCNSTDNICTAENLRMINKIGTTGYSYAKNYYYGSSVTWDGEKYTLEDPIEIENYNKVSNLSTHHYMCPSPGEKECQEVAYIHYYSGSGNMFYITLKDGIISSKEAINIMFTKNNNNSVIKTGVDAWYKHTLLDYSKYIEDIVFCNNRSSYGLNGWDPDGGKIDNYLFFKEHDWIKNLKCENESDQFSISNNRAKLNYPVGLATSPEIILLNNPNTRKTGTWYWMSAPFYYNDTLAYSRGVSEDGLRTSGATYIYRVSHNYGVRPTISLIPGIEFYDGDGSMEHPYIIETE